MKSTSRNLFLKVKRFVRDIYWKTKDWQIIDKICANPRAFLIYAPKEADRVYIDVYIKSGTAIEAGADIGVGHLLEHYISEKLSQKYHGDMTTNGRINPEYIHFYARIDKDKPKELIDGFLREIFEPVFNDETIINYEKLAVMNEFNTNTHNLSHHIERRVEKERFLGECSCLASFEASIEPTKQLTLADIQKHHAKIFNRNNVSVFVSTYRPLWRIKRYIINTVKNYTQKEGPATVYPGCAYSGQKIIRAEDKLVNGSYVYLTFPGLVTKSDMKDRIVFRLMVDLLTGRQDNFGINREARKAGIYSIESYWLRMENVSMLAISSFVPTDNIYNLIRVVNDGIKNLINNNVSHDYLRHSLSDLASVYRREWRSNEKVDWIINDIIEYGEYKNLEYYLAILRSIRPKDIREMAARTFDKNKLNLVIYGEIPAESDEEILLHLDFQA